MPRVYCVAVGWNVQQETNPSLCCTQVVVHNLPWGCTWQNLKDAFAASTQNIERADVIIDSSGRSRWVQVCCHLLTLQPVALQRRSYNEGQQIAALLRWATRM